MRNINENKKELKSGKKSAFLEFYKESVIDRPDGPITDNCNCGKFYQIFRDWCLTHLENPDLYDIECRSCVKRLLEMLGKDNIIKTNGGYNYYKDITLKEEVLKEFNVNVNNIEDVSKSCLKDKEKVVIYLNSNEYLDSKEIQTELMNNYCKNKNYEITKVYFDADAVGFIGTDYKNLLEAVCKKTVSKIIIYDFLTLAISTGCGNGLNHFLTILSSNNCKLELVDSYVDDLNDSTDWLKEYLKC